MMERSLQICIIWVLVSGITASLTLTATPQPVVEGSPVELQCTSDTDLIGNSVDWRRGGSQRVAKVEQITATTCTMSTDSSTDYTYRCDPPRVLYLTIPAVSSSEHVVVWYCTDVFGFGADVTLDVVVPVPSVTLTSPAADLVFLTLGTSQTFTCQTGGSRPEGRIEWYKDGQNVTVQSGTVTQNGDRYNTVSYLTLLGTKDNRLVTVQCTATNGYNTVPVESDTKTFVVQWPPDGQPSITGNNQNVWYPNDVVTLRCRQTGGNPLATLTWGGVCGGTPSTDRSTDTEAVTEIQITINSSYNQQSCICQSTHPQAPTTQTSTTFTVHYSPLPSQEPTITGYTTGQILYEGDPSITVLQCRQDGGFPLSVLTWNCFGLAGINRTQTEAVSEIQLTPTRGYNGRTCTCTATHPDSNVGYTRSVTVAVTVYYSPFLSQEPTITGYTTGQILYEGNPAIIVQCRQAGGFPLSVLTWDCFSLVGINRTHADAVSEIQLTPDRGYNGRTCTCTAIHPDSRVGYTRSVTVTVTVYYPPSVPTITQTPTTAWLEGQTGTLTCNYSVGYPTDTTVTWLEDGTPIQTSADDLVFGNLSKDHNGRTYRCRVSNGFTQNRPPDLSSSDLSLNVEYYPRVTLSDLSVVITEGQTVVVTCTAVGNPRPTIEWLQGENTVPISDTGMGTITVANGYLTIENVDRSATGNFICHAEGNTSVPGRNLVTEKVISLLVQYPPDVSIDAMNSTEGATVTLTCRGHGEPNIVTYVGWQQYIYNTLVRSNGDFPGISPDKKTITFDALSFRDTGIYRCDASNSIKDRQGNDVQSIETYFDVKVAAKFNSVKRRYEFYSKIGEPLEIAISFYSNPNVGSVSDIKWKHISRNKTVSASQNITFKFGSSSVIPLDVYGKTIQYTGQTAVMNISSFLLEYAGNYSITVNNDGDRLKSTSLFWIYLSDVPASPEAFEIVTKTSSSITVTWTKGFNGGHIQKFVILYRRHGSYTTLSREYTEKTDVTVYWATIGNLDPGTQYDFDIYSYNEQGNSTSIGKLAVTYEAMTAQEASKKDTSTGFFVGGAVMLVTGILFFIINIILCKRYSIMERCRQQNNKKEMPNELNTLDHRSNYEQLQTRSPPALYEQTNPQANSADYENSDPNLRSNYEVLEVQRDIHLYDTATERGRSVLYANTTLDS